MTPDYPALGLAPSRCLIAPGLVGARFRDSKSRFSSGSRHSQVLVRESNATLNPLPFPCLSATRSQVQIAGPQPPTGEQVAGLLLRDPGLTDLRPLTSCGSVSI